MGGLVSSIIDQNTAEKENRLREQEAWRQRAMRLSQYSPQIAGEGMRGEMQQISRDFAEAQAYGGAHARMLQLQNDQERLKQQIAIVERSKDYDKEMRAIQKENNRLQAQLGQKLVGATDELRKLVKTLPFGGDPFGRMLQGMQIPDDRRQDVDRENKRRRDADLNAPIFDGV